MEFLSQLFWTLQDNTKHAPNAQPISTDAHSLTFDQLSLTSDSVTAAVCYSNLHCNQLNGAKFWVVYPIKEVLACMQLEIPLPLS
jgi:hypothetical protein